MSEEERNIKKILVPIDGSDASLKAAKHAIKAAKCEKAQIICRHVIPAPENISEFEGRPFFLFRLITTNLENLLSHGLKK